MWSTKFNGTIASVIAVVFSLVVPVFADSASDLYDDDSYVASFADVSKKQAKTQTEKDLEALRGRWVYRYANTESGFYVGGFTGLSLANIGKNQTMTSYGESGRPWFDTYTKNKNYSKAFLFGFDGGYEFALSDRFLLDLGGAVYVGTNYAASGSVAVTANNSLPIATNNYSYNVTRMVQVMVESKFKWKIQSFLPYVTVGIGSSWNRAECYSVQPLANPNATVSLYNPNHKINLAYMLGLGVDYQFSNNDYIGIAYKYINLGKIDFDVTNDFPHTLSVGTIATHNITLNFTHRF